MNFRNKFFPDELAAPISRTRKISNIVCLGAFALILFRTAWVGDHINLTQRTNS